jgi:xylulose-5-phosphate/fructose-6-phosphate phosphoketolase
LRVRVVNVVDLMALQPPEVHPHGKDDSEFDAMFTRGRPVVFAYHGYPVLIHKLTYRRANHDNFHVHGYQEEGTTTTPFDMTVLNGLDRFHLAIDAVSRVPGLGARAQTVREAMTAKLEAHHAYIRRHGDDMPEIRDWKWPGPA